ncbi:MAG: tetratricopeptide repeat protein [Planctomycetota bacterium]
MKTILTRWMFVTMLGAALAAQAEPKKADEGGGTGAVTRIAMSEQGRAGLLRCKKLASQAKGLRGDERLRVIAEAAGAYDKLLAEFAAEKPVAAAAAFAAAGLWQRHGSLPLAEKDFLLAAETDPGRYRQRGMLGVADMQRRLKRYDEALASYGAAITAEPGSSHAQDARLQTARLLETMGRLDEAITMAQSALESAKPGNEEIEACNELALLQIKKGDLDAAARALDHAEESIDGVDNGDPIVAERLQKAVQAMSARRALQRARDKQNAAGADAVRLETERRGG